MTVDPTAGERFEDVAADPDAVLETFGAEAPDELIAQGGAHEPTTDERVDADDAVAAALFDDLSSVSLEAVEDSEGDDGIDDRDAHLSEPTVVVDEGGDEALEDLLSDRESDRPRRGEEPSLTGAKPTPVRIAGDAVERSTASADSTADVDGDETPAASVSRTDRFPVDWPEADGVDERGPVVDGFTWIGDVDRRSGV